MNVDTTTTEVPVDPNRSTDFHSIEIYIGDNHAPHAASSADSAAAANDTENEEERRLLHTLTLTCHKLQPEHNLSQHSDATSHCTDELSVELLGPAIDSALKSLYKIWLNSTSASHGASISLLQKSTAYGNTIVPDHEIEVVLSCILTIWHHTIDLLNTENQNGIVLTSVVLCSIQLVAQSMHYKRWKYELVYHQVENLVQLLTRTISLFLSNLTNNSESSKCNSYSNSEEKKNDEHEIDKSSEAKNLEPDSNIVIIKAAFRMIKDISNIGSYDVKNSNSTISDVMVVLYEAICPVICDCKVYSNTVFMFDVSGILWRWSVSLARSMVHNTIVWNAIEYMWMDCREQHSGIDDDKLVLRALSSTVGTLIASVSSGETTATKASSSPSPQSNDLNQNESIRTIQEQEWLIPMILKGIHSLDTDGQRRCIRTLRYFTASTWGKSFVYRYASRKDIILDLLPIIRNDGKNSDETCALACQVLEHILSDGYSELQLGPYIEMFLMETITGQSYGNHTENNGRGIASRNKLVWSACRALTASLQYSPWSRSAGCFTEALFEEILYILHNNIDQPSYHICFVDLFLQLVAEEQRDDNIDDGNEVKTTRIKGICAELASYSSVLEILAILLSPNATKPEFDVPRSTSIRILSVFLEHDDESCSIKKYMATDEHLLTALVNVCSINNGLTPFKDDAKRIILTLIPEL